MATSVANSKCVTNVEPAKIAIVNTIPESAELGEMFLLISDSHADDKKIHIKVASGWLKTSALS